MNEDHREVGQMLESAKKDVKAAIMCTLTATLQTKPQRKPGLCFSIKQVSPFTLLPTVIWA